MPRVKKRPKRRRQITADHRRALRTGHSFTSRFDANTGTMREVWQDLRGDILREWIRANSGSRPWAWWQFDAPERRKRIDGKPHPFLNPERQAIVEQAEADNPGYRRRVMRLSFGMPCVFITPDDWEATFELEAEYLDRLGLLTPAERKALAKQTGGGSDAA